MNLVQRYSNAIHSVDISNYTLFYRLLLKLYQEMPAVRPRVLHLLTEKLRALLQTQGQSAPIGELLRLDAVCANGAIQQPVHDIVATVALILHPVGSVPSGLGDRAGSVSSVGSAGNANSVGSVEQMKQELSAWERRQGVRRRLFNLLMERLVQSEVEEFKLDKGASFNPAEAEGKVNLAKRFVLSSLYLTAAYVRTAVLLEMTSASQSLHPVRILTLGQIATLLNSILVSARAGINAQKMNRFAGEKVKDPFAGLLAATLTARPALRNLLRLFVDLVVLATRTDA